MMDTLVIGGGIAGGAAALALRQRGARVTLIEPGPLPGAATPASAGMLAPQYESEGPGPLYELLVAARAHYPEFAELLQELTGSRLDLEWTGMLVGNRDAVEHEAAVSAAGWQRAAGQEAEVLSPDRARDLEPSIGDDFHSWLWLPSEGRVDSQELATRIGEALQRSGVAVIEQAARRLRTREDRIAEVELADGRSVQADQVILAAGAWTRELEQLPHPLPVRPVRGQMLRYRDPVPGLTRLVAEHQGKYLVPRADGSILAGSTMVDRGFELATEDAEAAQIAAAATRLLPGVGVAEAAERWVGFRPMAPDRFPILGPDPQIRGLFYAAAYGRNGILLGPLGGAILADLCLGEEPRADWRPFGIDRFLPTGIRSTSA